MEAQYSENDSKTQLDGLISKAHLDPGLFSLKLAANKKVLNPKQRGDFNKGRIYRWEDYEASSLFNSIKPHASASKAKQFGLGKETFSDFKPLKVYSRIRTRKPRGIQTSATQMKLKGVLMEEEIEEVDSDIDGDKPFLLKPDLSSISSSSDS